jgi:hypothetical protein
MAIMPVDQALMTLFDYCGVWPLTDGHHQVVVDIHFVDVTANRPLGVKYALILQDLDANRIVGYDNSHQYDGAGPDAPFDHEHRLRRGGERFQYNFAGWGQLIADFAKACSRGCKYLQIPFEFSTKGCHQ